MECSPAVSDFSSSTIQSPLPVPHGESQAQNHPKWKRKLIIRHHRSHWSNLLRGTVPIFVAACTSRAISSILDAVTGSGEIEESIIINVVYALFVAHLLGYLILLHVPDTNKLVDYYIDLANDNASFAWSTTLTLVILNWLYNSEHVMVSVIAWFALVLIVCFIIYAASYLQATYIKPSPEIQKRLQIFESESFALAVAYSLTVIIAVTIYRNASTNYLSDTDDLNATNDDGKDFSSASWFFLLYLLLITLVMVTYQRHLGFRKKRKEAMAVNETDGNEVLDEKQRLFYSEGDDDSDAELRVSLFTDDDGSDSETEEDNPTKSSSISYKINSISHALWQIFFPWDTQRHCWKTFRAFYFTSIGYLVSSGWTVWSLLTFEVRAYA